jgi:hypothetical protein
MTLTIFCRLDREYTNISAEACCVIAYHWHRGNAMHDGCMNAPQQTIRDLMLAGF